MPVLRRTHDHHRDFPTRDAATRAAGLSRTNRDGDAVTRHGSRPSDVVVMSLRPATLRAPSGSPASSSTLISDAISGLAHPQTPSAALPIRGRGSASRSPDKTSRTAIASSRVNTTPITHDTAKPSNPHKPRTAHRGFVLRRLSYAKRRPKLFTEGDNPLSAIGPLERPFAVTVGHGKRLNYFNAPAVSRDTIGEVERLAVDRELDVAEHVEIEAGRGDDDVGIEPLARLQVWHWRAHWEFLGGNVGASASSASESSATPRNPGIASRKSAFSADRPSIEDTVGRALLHLVQLRTN